MKTKIAIENRIALLQSRNKENGRVVGVFCGAMLSHNQNLVEEMNYLKPISHAIDLFKK